MISEPQWNNRTHLLSFFVILLIAALGCNSGNQEAKLGKQLADESAQSKKEAQRVAEACYDLIEAQALDRVTVCFAPDFYETTSEAELVEMLAGVNRKLGDLQRYELKDWQVRYQLTSNVDKQNQSESAAIVTLVYQASYTNASADEQVTLMKKASDKSYKIVGYQVMSDAFLDK